ncbi:MAG: vWA domain-containing protein [Pyrinomonadaceae bacterium]
MNELNRRWHTSQLRIGLLVPAFAIFSCGVANNTNRAGVSTPSQPTATPVAVVSATPAAEINNIVFIVDSSGSMKAKAGGKTKMDAAKEVVSGLIGELPPNVRAGLMAYGHRQKKDCKDIELLIPVGVVQKDVFTQKVQSLQPIGETPISASIRQAADVLKDLPGTRSIILISDGEESCQEDPCNIAAELKQADIDLKVHVVGFGLDSALAEKQLHCIAAATGGTYAEAKDAGQLKDKIAEAAGSATTSGDTGKLISVIRDMDGNQIKYGISFYKPGASDADEPIDSSMSFGMQIIDSIHELNIAPGVYDLRYTSILYPAMWRRGVEIKAGQETRVEFQRFGRLRISVKDQSGQSVSPYLEVHANTAEEEDLIVDHRFKEQLDLPAGVYDLKVREFWQKGVVVRSGEESPINIRLTQDE